VIASVCIRAFAQIKSDDRKWKFSFLKELNSETEEEEGGDSVARNR
jgi:hypothetical protein